MKWIIALISLMPGMAFADNEFYVYANFESVVSGFNRIALIFNDSSYAFLVYSVVFLAIMVAMLIKTGLGFMGKAKGNDVVTMLFVPLFGVALLKTMVLPTTTMHIYDPVKNRYESVGGVPSLIAIFAEGTNVLERFTTETLSSSSTARERHANGITLKLALDFIFQDPLMNNPYVKQNINSYIANCVSIAAVSQGYEFDIKDIETGTDNLLGELEKAKSNSVSTLYYDEDHKSGHFVSCSTAYTGINAVLTTGTTFQSHLKSVCESNHFDASNEEMLGICQHRIEEISSSLISPTGSPIAYQHIAASSAIAQSLYQEFLNKKGSAIASAGHTRQMSEGLGSLIVTEGYLPTMRYNVMLMILGLVPFFCLMFVTPMLFKSLHLMLTLFIFIGVWGLSDAMIHDIIFDQVYASIASLRDNNLGAISLLTAPNELQKSLAVFGKQQSMGILLALGLSTIFFKFTGTAFTRMGEKLTGDIDRIGNDAGQASLDPSASINKIDNLAVAGAKHDLYSNLGDQRTYNALGHQSTQQARSTDAYIQQMLPNYSMDEINSMPAQIQGSTQAGQVKATAVRANLDQSDLATYAQSNAFVDQTVKNADTEITNRNANINNDSEFVNHDNHQLSDALYDNQAISRSGSTARIKVFQDEGNAVVNESTKLTIERADLRTFAEKSYEQNPELSHSEAISELAARNKEHELTERESYNRLNDKAQDLTGFNSLQEAVDAKQGDLSLNLNEAQAAQLTEQTPSVINRGAGQYRVNVANTGAVVSGSSASGFSARTDNSDVTDNRTELNNSDVIDNRTELNNSITEDSSVKLLANRLEDHSDVKTDQITRSTGPYTQGNWYRSADETDALELLEHAAEQGTMEQAIQAMVQEFVMSENLTEQEYVADSATASMRTDLNGKFQILGSGEDSYISNKKANGNKDQSHLGKSATTPTNKTLGEHLGVKTNKTTKKPSIKPWDFIADLAGVSVDLSGSAGVQRMGEDRDLSQRDLSIDARTQALLAEFYETQANYPEEYRLQAEQTYNKFLELVEQDISQTQQEIDYDFNPVEESYEQVKEKLDDWGVGDKFKLF